MRTEPLELYCSCQNLHWINFRRKRLLSLFRRNHVYISERLPCTSTTSSIVFPIAHFFAADRLFRVIKTSIHVFHQFTFWRSTWISSRIAWLPFSSSVIKVNRNRIYYSNISTMICSVRNVALTITQIWDINVSLSSRMQTFDTTQILNLFVKQKTFNMS